MHWLNIFMSTFIAKVAKLTTKQLEKMIIEEKMTKQKKEIVIKILYNTKKVLTWDFIEMERLKEMKYTLRKSE